MENRADVNVGDVWYADLSPSVGNELGGLRKVSIKEVYDDVVVVWPTVFCPEIGKFLPSRKHIRSIDRSRLTSLVKEDACPTA